MTFREVVLTIDGLREKEKYLHDLLRRVTMIIGCSGFGGKEIAKNFERLWPDVTNINKPSRREQALETLKKFREQDNKKEDLKKVKGIINGRPEDNSRG